MKVFKPVLIGFSIMLANSCYGLANASHEASMKTTAMPPAPMMASSMRMWSAPPTPAYDYAAYRRKVHFSHECPTTKAFKSNGFTNNSSLDVNLRAGYREVSFDKKFKELDWNKVLGPHSFFNSKKIDWNEVLGKPDGKQMGIGTMVDWKSGFVDNWFGINGSLYGGLRLHADGPGTLAALYGSKMNTESWDSVSMLKGEPRDYDQDYGRIARFNAKARFGTHEQGALVYAGLIGADDEYLHSVLLAPEPQMLTMTSARGVSFKAKLQKLHVYGAWWDRIANQTSAGYHHFSNGRITTSGYDPESIDHVALVGAGYRIPLDNRQHSLYLNAEYAEGKNYLQEYFGQATYRIPVSDMINLTANGQYYYVRRDGKLWDRGVFSSYFDKNAHLANFNVNLGVDHFCIDGAYTKTKAKSSSSSSSLLSHRFYHSPAANYAPGGRFGTSRMESDFAYDGEDAYLMGVGYDFTDFVPGLSAKISYTHGDNITNKVSLKNESETDLMVTWYVPMIKGLWVALENAYYKIESKEEDYGMKELKHNDFKGWVNYQVSVF